MAFIPESDAVIRCKRRCGVDGRKVAAEVRESIRYTALTGQEPNPVPVYLTRPDRHVNYANAEIFAHGQSWLRSIAEKPTWDYPPGGKQMSQQRRHPQPSPIITPEYITTISGSVRRMGAVDIPPEKLRSIWSEGREVAKRDFAAKMAQTPSPIPYQNPPSRLEPIKIGTKPIAGRSNMFADSRPPQPNCVMGFKGVGNHLQAPTRPPKVFGSSAVPFSDLPFYGERKPLYSAD